MKFLIGQKKKMTRVFSQEGDSFAVSIIDVLPIVVSQIKTVDNDGYNAVKVKVVNEKLAKLNKEKSFEFRVEDVSSYKVGDSLKTEQFEIGDKVSVFGKSKGKGFSGTIKRHDFHRGPASHGSHNVRQPGSIGGAYPERVVKGRKMAGKMGSENTVVKNLKVIDLDSNNLVIKGAIPGPNKSIVKIMAK